LVAASIALASLIAPKYLTTLLRARFVTAKRRILRLQSVRTEAYAVQRIWVNLLASFSLVVP
jgi:hypothetical protein